MFPFIYNGHVHRECTRDGGFSTPWCSTKTDAWGFHVKVELATVCPIIFANPFLIDN